MADDWTQIATANAPSARVAMGMAFDPLTIGCLLFGGFDGSSTLSASAETWLFDGSDWTQLFPAHSPSARFFPAMGNHNASNTVVLYGGRNNLGNGIRDTWEWDGTDWTQVFPATGPSIRFNSQRQMAHNASINALVFFGGFDGSYLQDTWRFDVGGWTALAPVHKPAARQNGGLAQGLSGGTLLFGGSDGSGFRSDTWSFSGTDWTNLAPAHNPSARDLFGIINSSVIGAIVLFGGKDNNTTGNAETWTFDGTDWTQQAPTNSPPARFSHGIGFDPITGNPLIFGGQTAIGPHALNDTWVYGVNAAEFEVSLGYGGLAPGGGADRTNPSYLQSALSPVELTPGCIVTLRALDAGGNTRTHDSWSNAVLWVDDGS